MVECVDWLVVVEFVVEVDVEDWYVYWEYVIGVVGYD